MNASIRYAILMRDPDGFDEEPTLRDYELFDEWILATYGQDAYNDYYRFQSKEYDA